MRSGVAISALAHVLLVSLLMLGRAAPFDVTTQPIEVDLVRAEEVEPPKEPPKPETPNLWEQPQEKPPLELPRLEPFEKRQAAARQKQAAAPAAQSSSQQAAAPSNSQQAALQQPQSNLSMAAPSAPRPAPSVFDPANIPALLELPTGHSSGFDAEALTKADISGEERALFKSHLRKCWKLPGGASPAQATRVVVRVNLRRDGRLATEPMLIEASASRDGLTVLETAKRALKDCQPFAFLPADKYSEWRVLDLSFTPLDMAGGT